MHSQKERSETPNQDTVPSSKCSTRAGTHLTVNPVSSQSPGSSSELATSQSANGITQRDPSTNRNGVPPEGKPVHVQGKMSDTISNHKPSVAPKSSRVLAIAEEILRSRRRRSNSDGALWDSKIYDDIVNLRGTSSDDIYDDIITVLRNAESNPETNAKDPRPSLPPKPTWLQSRAVQSSSQPGSKPAWQKSSYEDIYDDVVVQRLREAYLVDSHEKIATRPQLPTKSPMLYKHPKVIELLQQLREKRSSGCSEVELEDIYDDILSALAKVSITTSVVSTEDQHSHMPDHNAITADSGSMPAPDSRTTLSDWFTSAASNGSEDAYVNLQPPEAISGSRRVQLEPNESSPYEVPSKSVTPGLENEQPQTTLLSPKKEREKRISQWSLYENECLSAGRIVQYREEKTGVIRRSRLIRSRSQLVDPSKKEAVGRRSRSTSQIDVDSVEVNDQDETKWTTAPARQSKTADKSKTLPAGRRTFDPLPEIHDSLRPQALQLVPHDSDSGSETYEDLPLYEDLWDNQPGQRDDPYQDMASVVAKALDLPEMRQRATRITIGHRKQLKRFAKLGVKKLQRTQSLPNRKRPPRLKKVGQETKPDADSSRKESVDETTADVACETIMEENKSSESNEEEELGAIPFGKSREVFEMLLDASGIERAAESTIPDQEEDKTGEDLSKPTPEKIEQCVSSGAEEEDEPFGVPLPDDAELRQYQEAGVIYVRSKSEIAAEIEQLTASAPPVPPPLPGLSRQRTKIITRTENLLHKRFLIRRAS